MINYEFSNSYSMDLYRQQQARKEHSEKITNGAEKTLSKDKDTARVIARNEYGADQSARMYADLARYYRMGVNPPDEVLEKIYSTDREV